MAEVVVAPASSSVCITQLNDDCFYEIFQYLELGDQMRFAMGCVRLASAYQSYCQLHPIVLRKDDLNSVSLKELRCFFAMVGNFVEELIQLPYKDCERNHYVTLVNRHCPNVKRICFAMTKIKSKCLRKLLVNMQHVTELRLSSCSVDDKAMLGVSELRTLEVLHMSRNAMISGKHLGKLTNLRELNLFDCGILDNHFIEICKSLKQLRKLNISHCSHLTNVGHLAISMYCDRLEELKMFCNSGLITGLFARLRQLKLLCYEYVDRTGSEWVRQMSTLANLETLSLADCYSLSNTELLQVVRNCTKLKYVNVIFCRQISNDFVYDAIDLLQEQYTSGHRSSESGPVVFLVSKTDITRDLLESPVYLRATEFIRVSFANAYYYNYLCYTYMFRTKTDDDDYSDFMPFLE